jgi:hypothetical protein
LERGTTVDQKTAELLNTLAGKLGTKSSQLWEVLLKQALIAAMGDMLLFIVCILGIAMVIKWNNWCALQTKVDDCFETTPHIAGIIGGTLILSTFSVVCIYNIATELLNPGFFALQQILKVLK